VGCEKPEVKVADVKPPVVIVAAPVTREVTDYEDFPGRTDAVHTVEVRARVTGYLDKVLFKDGDEVKKDDLLFVIDPRPYKADLERAEATVSQGLARLKRLDADNQRAQQLYKRNAIGQEEYDRITGDYAEGVAAVGIAKANRDLAELTLKFTEVRAPISGRLSRRLVDPGNLVQADSTPLTTIVSLDPMYVYFDIDEGTLLQMRSLIKEGRIKTRQEAEIPVLAALSDEPIGTFPHRGHVNFSDNKVDPNTGTLRVRGVIDNPIIPNRNFRTLSPGLFMRVRLPIGTPHQAILVPEQAVGTDQGRRFVYVVNDKNEAVYRPLKKVGALTDGMRVVEEGIAANDRIIVRGLQRVKPGKKVEPKLDEAPKTAANPSPPPGEDSKSASAKSAPKG
jgi:RND family efflux transporter MFP subunit